VEAGVVGDVRHARDAEQASVGVDHRRRVVGAVAGALEQVQHDDDAEVAGAPGESVGRRSRHGLGLRRGVGIGRPLRVEGLEGQLGEAGQVRTLAGGLLERRQSERDVGGLLGRRRLLDEGDTHGEV